VIDVKTKTRLTIVLESLYFQFNTICTAMYITLKRGNKWLVGVMHEVRFSDLISDLGHWSYD